MTTLENKAGENSFHCFNLVLAENLINKWSLGLDFTIIIAGRALNLRGWLWET